MTGFSISSSSAFVSAGNSPTSAVSQNDVLDGDSQTFSQVMEQSDSSPSNTAASEQSQPAPHRAMRSSASETAIRKPDSKKHTEEGSALENGALLAGQQQQHTLAHHRSWSLSLPGKEKSAVDSGGTGDTQSAEKTAAATLAAGPQVISKQQIAFGATLTKSPASNHSEAESQDKVTAVDDKASTTKQHSGSADPGRGDSPSSDPDTPKFAAASAITSTNSSAPIHTSAPQPTTSMPVASPALSAYAAPVQKMSAPQPASAPAAVVEEPVVSAPRSQTIDLQTGDVSVRVSQRAGDVQITVRTPDTDVAQSLRQHLPELADKLTQTGVHADLWTPSTEQSNMSGDHSDSQSDTDSQAGQQQSNASDQQREREQQNQSDRQSAWKQELNYVGLQDPS